MQHVTSHIGTSLSLFMIYSLIAGVFLYDWYLYRTRKITTAIHGLYSKLGIVIPIAYLLVWMFLTGIVVWSLVLHFLIAI